MLELLKWVGFLFLFLRFSYWVGSSLAVQEKKWKRVLVSQALEALLLFFIYSQLFGKSTVLPLQQGVWSEAIGFILVVIGVGGAFLAKQELGGAWVYAGAQRIKPKQKLVTSGMYSITRHPIYSCFIVSYLGAEVLAGSYLFVSVLFLFLPFYFQAKKEEANLLKHFGKQYEAYTGKAKMLIPFLL